jgi:hypothetical protein
MRKDELEDKAILTLLRLVITSSIVLTERVALVFEDAFELVIA